jgi:hypothetical protein
VYQNVWAHRTILKLQKCKKRYTYGNLKTLINVLVFFSLKINTKTEISWRKNYKNNLKYENVKEERILRDNIYKLTVIRRLCGMKIKVQILKE